MKESPSWGANISSSNHEITHILRSPKAHYRIHNSPSLAAELNKLHLPSHPISLISTIILFSHLRLSLPSCLFHSSRFQVTFAHILSSLPRVLHATPILHFLFWSLRLRQCSLHSSFAPHKCWDKFATFSMLQPPFSYHNGLRGSWHVVIILCSASRQVHSPFQSEVSTECDLELPLSISGIFSFP